MPGAKQNETCHAHSLEPRGINALILRLNSRPRHGAGFALGSTTEDSIRAVHPARAVPRLSNPFFRRQMFETYVINCGF